MADLMTWDQRPRYTGAPVINTVALALSAIAAAITANSTYWEVSDSAAQHLEIKRKVAGGPAGELASVRFLLFGGASPNAGALQAGITPSAAHLYAALCVDAATTGPVQSPTVGNPYNGKSRVILGTTVTIAFSGSASSFVHIIETPEVLVLLVGRAGAAAAWSIVMGRCVTDENDTARWAVVPSTNEATTLDFSAANAIWFIPESTGTPAGVRAWVEIDSAGAVRALGRALVPQRQYGLATKSLLDSGVNAHMLPVYLARCRTLTVSEFYEYAGVMRQMKFGPRATCGQVLTVSGVTKGYAIAGEGDCTHPLWATTDP